MREADNVVFSWCFKLETFCVLVWWDFFGVCVRFVFFGGLGFFSCGGVGGAGCFCLVVFFPLPSFTA